MPILLTERLPAIQKIDKRCSLRKIYSKYHTEHFNSAFSFIFRNVTVNLVQNKLF